MSGNILETVGHLIFWQNDLLGAGKFGPIYQGKFQTIFEVAISRVDQKKFFVDETALLSAQRHPNILHLYCFEKDSNYVYISTELNAGTLLDVICGDYKGPKLGEYRVILSQVATGLRYLHKINMFHRDLKPENVLVTLTCGSLNPMMKLGNFGIYRVAQHPLPLCDVAGSQDWMAPEVYESETYTAEMDRYALGLLIAFSLSGGRHPFGRIGSDEVSTKIRLKLPMSLTTEQLHLAGKMAGQVFQLVKELLNVDPSKRPTLAQVLVHPFFNKTNQREERMINEEVGPSETGEPAAKKLKGEPVSTDDVVTASSRYLNRSDLPDEIAYTGYVRQNVSVGMKVSDNRNIGIVLQCDKDYMKVGWKTESIYGSSFSWIHCRELELIGGNEEKSVADYVFNGHSSTVDSKDQTPSSSQFLPCSSNSLKKIVSSVDAQVSSCSKSKMQGNGNTATTLRKESNNSASLFKSPVKDRQEHVEQPSTSTSELAADEPQIKIKRERKGKATKDTLPSQNTPAGSAQVPSVLKFRSTFKSRPEFKDTESYASYVHTHIGVNMRVRSCVHIKGGASTEEVCIGDEGLVTSNLKDESPLLSTLEVLWDKSKSKATVLLNQIEIIEKNRTYAKQTGNLPKSVPVANKQSISASNKSSSDKTKSTAGHSSSTGNSNETNADQGTSGTKENQAVKSINNETSLLAQTISSPATITVVKNGTPKTSAGKNAKSVQDQLFAMCKTQTKWTEKKLAEFRHLVMDKSVQINAVNKDGLTALLLVCWKQSSGFLLQLVTILLERPDLDVNVMDEGEWNALGMVCRHCQNKNLLSVIRLLLDRRIQVNSTNKDGDNALIVLCANYNVSLGNRKEPNQKADIIRLLIESGVSVHATNKFGWNALHTLCRNHTSDNLPELIRILLDAGVSVTACDKEGNNPLLLICAYYRQENLVDTIRLLLSKGTDVKTTNLKGMDALFTILFFFDVGKASMKIVKLKEIVEVFLAAGANVNSKTKEGWNALLAHFSQQYLHEDFVDVAKFLVEVHHIDVNVKSAQGLNALLYLCWHYKGNRLIEAVKMLVDHGIDVNATSSQQWNALIFLAQNFKQTDKFSAVTQLLTVSGLNINWRDEEGSNLLHWLCNTPTRKNLLQIIRFLLKETTIDRNAVDNVGRKPVDFLLKLSAAKRKINDIEAIIEILNKSP